MGKFDQKNDRAVARSNVIIVLSLRILLQSRLQIGFHLPGKRLGREHFYMQGILQSPVAHCPLVYRYSDGDFIVGFVRECHIVPEPVEQIVHYVFFRPEGHGYAAACKHI